jgi:hypothetical protein
MLPAGTTDLQTLQDVIAVMHDLIMPKINPGMTGAAFSQGGAIMISDGGGPLSLNPPLTPAAYAAALTGPTGSSV